MECGGAGALPPATLFEITLGKGKDQDYYDISLVDGYNLPVAAAPRVPRGRCNITGCAADLNRGNYFSLLLLFFFEGKKKKKGRGIKFGGKWSSSPLGGRYGYYS